MEEHEIIAGNKLIAEFMGFSQKQYLWNPPTNLLNKYPKCIFEGDNTNSFLFHKSWDWLMPVVEKIEGNRFLFCINKREIEIEDYINYPESTIVQIDRYDGESKIDMVWMAVIKFIKWYKEHEK